MCPACVASAAVMVGGLGSTGGIAAFIAKIFHSRRCSIGHFLNSRLERRNRHGFSDGQERSTQGAAAC